MKPKNPILFTLFFLFLFVNIIDWVTGFFVLSAESNPIYLFTKSYLVVTIVKFGFVYLVWYIYKKNEFPSKFYYYFIILALVLGIPTIGLAAYSNILGMNATPEEILYYENMPSTEKASIYFSFVGVVFMIPFIISLVAFWLYDKSIKYVRFIKDKR